MLSCIVFILQLEFNYDFREPGDLMEMGIFPCTAMDHWLRASLMGMEVNGPWLWAHRPVMKQNIAWSDPKILSKEPEWM